MCVAAAGYVFRAWAGLCVLAVRDAPANGSNEQGTRFLAATAPPAPPDREAPAMVPVASISPSTSRAAPTPAARGSPLPYREHCVRLDSDPHPNPSLDRPVPSTGPRQGRPPSGPTPATASCTRPRIASEPCRTRLFLVQAQYTTRGSQAAAAHPPHTPPRPSCTARCSPGTR